MENWLTSHAKVENKLKELGALTNTSPFDAKANSGP
jgi:hypothetical protein